MPTSSTGERLEAVDEALVDDPLGRSDRVALERDDRCQARAARLGDHREQRLGRAERLQQVGHLGHRRIGEATAGRARKGCVAAERRAPYLEQAAELVVGAPRAEVEQLVGGPGFAGLAQQPFDASGAPCVAEVAESSHVFTPAKWQPASTPSSGCIDAMGRRARRCP